MRSQKELSQWLVGYLADKLDIDIELVDTSLTFDRYGLDSLTATCLMADLGERVGEELDPSLIYDYPTIDALTGYLGGSGTATHSIESGCAEHA